MHQTYVMLLDLFAHGFECRLIGQTKHSNLLYQLRAFSLPWEQRSQGKELHENAPYGPDINFLRVIAAG